MIQRLRISWLVAISRLSGVIRRPGFWLLVVVLVLITIPHYRETLGHPAFINQMMARLGLERHAFERILYLAPIVWAGFLFGQRGVLIVSLTALAVMLPRAIFISQYPTDAIFETSAVFVVGNLVAFSFQSLRKEREHRIHLDTLNQTSNVLSRSLELSQVLDASIDSVMDVIRADAALLFLVDEKAGELTLAAHKGVSKEVAQGVDRLKLGEGFNGKVAETGRPLYVEDASKDPDLTRQVIKEVGRIQSQVIVPLKSKGKVVGTLCVAMRSHRRFGQDEVELLTTIGSQIGVAIENAHLYQQERQAAEQLRVSEERYRELFENAHDAIWLRDLDDNIIAANDSFARLTGYTLEELKGIKAGTLIAEGCMDSVKDMEGEFLKGEVSDHLTEVTVVKKDKSQATVQLSTSPVFSQGKLVAFQHIARDVTEEKRMKENLRFYLEQVTRAQEEERKRIARELHDDTIQALVVVSRQLDDLATNGKGIPQDKRLLLENLRQQTNNIMEGVRRLSQDLRPAILDRLGLLPALEWLASTVSEHSGIGVEVKAHGAERRLPAEIELVIFRIAQEALRNVWRHSQATKAEVIVEFTEAETSVTVKDNGKGFDLPASVGDLARYGKLGLAGMQERARLLGGNLTAQSTPGKGTTISVVAPM